MDEKCLLCQHFPNIAYGEWLKYRKCHFHYLCLLLSPALYQKADEDNGLFGFIGKNVVKEEKRIEKQRCSYCKKPHASLSCVIKECKRSFHIDCGLEQDCQYRMTDFQTFCHEHRELEKTEIHSGDVLCAICLESMGEFRYNESIHANCCKESWYHRMCLVQMTASAGYFTRCPLCKNEDAFKNQVMEQGVFVPERDATWELEPNAFAEQLERSTTCSAKRCLCTRGRNYSPKNAITWDFTYCQACGHQSIHKPCLQGYPTFICDICAGMGANALLEDLPPTLEQLEAQMKPCYVKLERLVSKKMKKNETTSKPQRKFTKPTSKSGDLSRWFIVQNEPNFPQKRKQDPDESNPPPKRMKIDENPPRFVSPSVAAAVLRKMFLDPPPSPPSTTSESSASNDSSIENQPPTENISLNISQSLPKPKANLAQSTIDSFFKRNVIDENT